MKKNTVLTVLILLVSVSLSAQKADLSAQWNQAKIAAEKAGISLPSTPLNGSAFETENVDDDTFRELKAQFEADKTLNAVFLIEKGTTWVFSRYDRWWMPAATALIGSPLILLGIIKDNNGTLLGLGAGLAVAGAVGGFFIMEKSEVSNMVNEYTGKAAVFIKKQ